MTFSALQDIINRNITTCNIYDADIWNVCGQIYNIFNDTNIFRNKIVKNICIIENIVIHERLHSLNCVDFRAMLIIENYSGDNF